MSEFKEKPEHPDLTDAVRDARPSVKAVFVIIGGLLVAIVAILALAALLVSFFGQPTTPANNPQPPSVQLGNVPEGPRLQVAEAQDMAELRAAQMEILNSYGWVDQASGVAHIPIERAMAVLLEQGLPVAPNRPADNRVNADESGFFHPELDANRPAPPAEEGLLIPWGEAPAAVPTAPPDPAQMAQQGLELFQSLGCAACHTGQQGAIAPSLTGVYSQTVTLEGGETVTADENYLRNSITQPNDQVVAGFQPIMPSFADRLTPEELDALVEYIKSLAP